MAEARLEAIGKRSPEEIAEVTEVHVVIVCEELGLPYPDEYDLEKATTWQEALGVYHVIPGGSELANKALAKCLELTTTWKEAYEVRCYLGGRFGKKALVRYVNLLEAGLEAATTWQEAREVYNAARKNEIGKLESKAWKKMLLLAHKGE